MESFEEVEKTLRAIMIELDGRFPTPAELRHLGRHTLVRAIISKWGGFPKVRRRMGIEYLRVPYGSWRDAVFVEEQMSAAIQRNNGRFPTSTELREMKCNSLEVAITTYHDGLPALRKKMGYDVHPTKVVSDLAEPKQTKKVWREWRDIEDCLSAIITDLGGDFPTQKSLNQAGYSGLADAIAKRYGGMTAVRNRMGYGPITDNLLIINANDLAQIVIELGIPTDPFWSAMKERWIERDLTAAIAEFKETRSLERFRQLLDGD